MYGLITRTVLPFHIHNSRDPHLALNECLHVLYLLDTANPVYEGADEGYYSSNTSYNSNGSLEYPPAGNEIHAMGGGRNETDIESATRTDKTCALSIVRCANELFQSSDEPSLSLYLVILRPLAVSSSFVQRTTRRN